MWVDSDLMLKIRPLTALQTLEHACDFGPTLEGIPGWLHALEGEALYQVAKETYGGVVVELGSFMGLSTSWLAQGVRDRGSGEQVIAVDTFEGVIPTVLPDSPIRHYGPTLERFEANLRRLGLWDYVRPIQEKSAEAGRKWEGTPVRLLFIDAGHEYEDIDADLAAWMPHMAPDGVIAIHDVGTFPGVTKRYDELVHAGHTRLASIVSLRFISSRSASVG